MSGKILIIALICFILINCSRTEKRNVTQAFYYWKSTFELSPFEEDYITNLEVKKLYIKFFDVDWNFKSRQAVPVAVLNLGEFKVREYEIIPTVFITNRSLLHLNDSLVNDLSAKITDKILTIVKDLNVQIKEIQLDCDWTEKTAHKYFQLIEGIKSELKDKDIIFSATIRLHQVKYYIKTKVPPVDKGMLMFYNMGKVDDPGTFNSILDIETAKKYLVNFDKYPLKLDVALPVFAWGVIIRRGKMIKLINNLITEDLVDKSRYEKIDQNRFKILNSHYLEGYYLYQNDVIRLESVDVKMLNESAILLSEIIINKDIVISFFHLNEKTLKHYYYEDLKTVFNNFN